MDYETLGVPRLLIMLSDILTHSARQIRSNPGDRTPEEVAETAGIMCGIGARADWLSDQVQGT